MSAQTLNPRILSSIIKPFVAAGLMLLIASSSPALEPAREETSAGLLPGGDSPAGELVIMRGPRPRKLRPLTPWLERTGTRKGVTDHVLDQEVFAAPDAAVLKGGFFEPWPDLLMELQEPSVLVEAGAVAGLEKSKRYLIIPTGALSGSSASEFFKAGLAEFAAGGGVIVCFAQQNGADFTSLPVHSGAKLEAAGWAQDSGPLFRASSVQGRHPLLSSLRKTLPNVETNGYLISYPPEATVLLARPDGFPTLIVYPYGSGWVVLSTLFSDISYELGRLDPVEKGLVRDMLLWAKAPGRIVQASAGEQLNFNLGIPGPEQGEATRIRLMLVGPDYDAPISEQVLPFVVKAGQSGTLSFSPKVPIDAQPGIHHIEYVLLDSAGRSLSARAESDAGFFSVGQPVVLAPLLRQKQPLTPFPAQFRVQASLDRSGDKLKMNFELIQESKTVPLAGQDFYLRAAGQEKFFRLTDNKTSLSLDVSGKDPGNMIAYTLYHSSGRSLVRGVLPVANPAARGVFVENPYALPGQQASFRINGLGSGELTLNAPGLSYTRMVSENGTIPVPLPAGLPTGTYTLQWEHRTVEGELKRGELPFNILGNSVQFQGASLEKKLERGVYNATALIRVKTSQKISSRMKLWLRPPGRPAVLVADNEVKLSSGVQDLPFKFTFKPEQGGMWELFYSSSVSMLNSLESAPQFRTIASGRKLFDVGEAAMLGLATGKPVYYEPTGPVELSASVFGLGKARLEIYLDGKRIRKEKLELAGAAPYTTTLTDVKPGSHSLRAVVTGEKIESVRELPFIYGARLPDLTISLEAGGLAGIVLPVGIGITNRGKLDIPKSRAALYEGDPAKDGTLIAAVDVPPIKAGEINVSLVEWPLYKKAGKRTLVAVADIDGVVTESNKNNNTASLELTIPELLLISRPSKDVFTSEESMPLSITMANLTVGDYKDLNLSVRLIDVSGKVFFTDTVPVPEFARESEKKFDRTIRVPALPLGAYQVSTRISRAEKSLADFSYPLGILPTLQLKGSLDGTPATAALCRPFTVQYTVNNTGNIPPSSGSLNLEIKAAGAVQPLFTRQLALTMDTKTITLDKLEIPRGQYVLSLKASAANPQYKITTEFPLAEQPLSVSGPVEFRRSAGSFPRVLVWAGQADTAVEQAVSENILKQAFEQENIYYKIVDKADAFINQAVSGAFNTYVLFETNELLDKTEWLKDRIARGEGLLIIGSGEITRAAMEAFGYRFGEERSETGALISLSGDSGLGLSGTVPVSGRILSPLIEGTKTAAEMTDTKQPAALIDRKGKGPVALMTFSFIRSARDAGTTALYSLLLRSAVRSATPESEAPGGEASTGELVVSSSTGPVKARIKETLPEGSRVVWTNAGVVNANTITYELTADREPQKFLYLYQAAGKPGSPPSADVFYDCDGKSVNQGKL